MKTLSGLEALLERAGDNRRGPPPVDRWNPDYSGEIDIEIRRDGSWHHEGSPINRMPLVRLFASVLRKEDDGRTYLVTPVEKLGIRIEDAPFLAVEMHRETRDGTPVITFRTNVGDVVEAGPQNRLRFENGGNEGVKPYLDVRSGLEALLTRPVTYELLSHGKDMDIDGKSMFAIESNGAQFAVMASDELARRMADE